MYLLGIQSIYGVLMINIEIDVKELERRFKVLGRQADFAMMATINKLAYEDVKPAFRAEMTSKLDKPTPFTLNAISIAPAKKNDLMAKVFIRDEAHKGTAPAEYLAPMASGGEANLKRSEKLLRRRGVLKGNQRLVPGRRTKLNQYGNWTAGQMNKALSNIGHQHDSYQNTKQHTRRKKGKARFDYFLIKNGHSHLTPGIWYENRGWAAPFVIFAEQSAKRKAVLDFEKAAAVAVRRNFNKRCEEAMKRAIATAIR